MDLASVKYFVWKRSDDLQLRCRRRTQPLPSAGSAETASGPPDDSAPAPCVLLLDSLHMHRAQTVCKSLRGYLQQTQTNPVRINRSPIPYPMGSDTMFVAPDTIKWQKTLFESPQSQQQKAQSPLSSQTAT